MTPRRRFGCLAVAGWPARDRERWLSAQQPGPRRISDGRWRNWSPKTWSLTERGYGAWLWWLASRDAIIDASAPEDRATPDELAAYVDDMEAGGLSDFTRVGRVQAVRDALRVLAPSFDSMFVSLGASRMRSLAERSQDFSPRMRPAAEIFGLGLHLMRAAESGGVRRERRPVYYRDGLLIAFLICCPLRARSLAAMTTEHVTKKGSVWQLILEREETKTGQVFACPWPEVLAPHLERYLACYRPSLAAGRKATDGERALWLSTHGSRLDESCLAQAIEIRTRDEFGRHINPHLFRHIAATEIAEYAPQDVSDAAAVLGHASLDTTLKYYIHARAMRAVRDYQRLILALMKDVQAAPRGGRDGISRGENG